MSGMHGNKTWKIGGTLEVNRFGFGAMRITGDGIIGPPKNESEAINVLRRAVALGVNFIDTADSYGPNVSEELIARALYPYPPDLVIATKGGQIRPGPDKWVPDGRPEHLKEVLYGSLKRLKLERIALYQLHRRDPKVPFAETLGFLREAQQKGLIQYIGLSELDAESVEEARKIVEVVSLQNKFSFDHRRWEPELQYCAQHQIAFIPWHPINAGNILINGKLQRLAAKYEASAQQLALKWLFNYSDNILLIPGTSKEQHLEENMAAAQITLSQEDFDYISNGLHT